MFNIMNNIKKYMFAFYTKFLNTTRLFNSVNFRIPTGTMREVNEVKNRQFLNINFLFYMYIRPLTGNSNYSNHSNA